MVSARLLVVITSAMLILPCTSTEIPGKGVSFFSRKNYNPYHRNDKEVLVMSTAFELVLVVVLILTGKAVTRASESKKEEN